MAIDFQQIYEKIRLIGKGARERRERIEKLRKHARNLLEQNADELDYLRRIVEIVKETDPNIRCALPLNESLASHVPAPASAMDATLIAADGSQVFPNRNLAVQYCIINTGCIAMQLNSGKVTDTATETELFLEDEWETQYGPATEGMIALHRDFRERSKLEEFAQNYRQSIVTIADGPMELWEPKGFEELQAFEKLQKEYLGVLSRLQSKGIITSGYIDNPRENLVIRLLELVEAQREKEPPANFRDYYPLRGVSDRWLYGEKSDPLLGPGERSAVFAIQSKSEKYYKGVLGLHFFYLNVGTERHPYPVRVEIPKWVADDKAKLDLLHAVLVDQCRMMGSKPYPYLLHRAHEIAVVKHEEKYQVEQMLTQELRRQDEEIGDGSYKQSAKDLPGRIRR
jgi:hypothetical protein